MVKDKRFECRFGMYLDNHGIDSAVYGTDIIDAIRKRNQYAILLWLEDDGVEYFVKEHDEPDSRGYYNYYWVDINGKVLYDENNPDANPAPEKPKPIYIGKTTTDSGWISPNGKFYECGFEQHTSFADFLLETEVVKYVDVPNSENYLEEKKWLKLSTGQIRYHFKSIRDKMTKKQKDTIVNYFTTKNKRINILGKHFSYDEFYEEY